MSALLLWIPALPLAGFGLLVTVGGWLGRGGQAAVGVGSVALAFLLAAITAGQFLVNPPQSEVFTATAWTWMAVGDLRPDIGFYFDPLALVMTLVITGVGLLIHIYSAEFMAGESGHRRYFAYLNLFVAAMVVLVLADNLPFLYLGWEGVGLCSYLLIGFWYEDPANGHAARKAFIVTRIGDVALIVGLFLLFAQLGTLEIQPLLEQTGDQWPVGSPWALVAAFLLLGGAVGKSAQLPLQTWLPDAMAGPTPVSALIHAATMVTAGVYLVARFHPLFLLAPPAQTAVAAVGGATLLMAAASALVQRDIKRILAYSTISQIGYMFLALGVGAWSAAIFHFLTHAFFKALLFLAAGAVIMTLHDEHDIFRMGGLRRHLPIPFWGFLIGGAALAGFPLVTAGFFSKDLILIQAWAANPGWWVLGWVGALLTALYSFRAVFLVFFGPLGKEPSHQPGLTMVWPIGLLAGLSVAGGWLELPATLGNLPLLSELLSPVWATHIAHPPQATEAILEGMSVAASLGGIGLAYGVFLRGCPLSPEALGRFLPLRWAQRFGLQGWGFDWLYEHLFTRPLLALARWNRDDGVDRAVDALIGAAQAGHGFLSQAQTGRLRDYVFWLGGGVALFLLIVGLR